MTQATQPTLAPERDDERHICEVCDETEHDVYFGMMDEFDALVLAIQAQRHFINEAEWDNPLRCPRGFAQGWERIASLTRVLEAQAARLSGFDRNIAARDEPA